MNHGNFVISLDFELFWGVRDKVNLGQYQENILGVHTVIPRLLKTFREYEIKATFSTVGFLFFENKKELIGSLPESFPSYKISNLSPYHGHFDKIGDNYIIDKHHYAPDLIKLILEYPEQEIGSHTFSHYYCLEEGQSVHEFKLDIESAINVAKVKYGITITSLVFPRNQFNDEYMQACHELGILCFRGNEHSWIYEAKKAQDEYLFRRAFKLLDSYLNISGHNCYTDAYLKSKCPIDIPASRFLRPFSKRLKFFEKLRERRIKSDMTFAAKNNLTYHLWWHPHNFGINQHENFSFLERILAHYKDLNHKYRFQSSTMSELAKRILNPTIEKNNL